MPGIRTVFVTLPPLLGDIIRRLMERRVPLDVVDVLDSRDALAERLRLLAPALILIGLDPGEDDAVAASLAIALAGARVLALAHDARAASLHEAGKAPRALPDPSPRELIEAIREV
ncbi:MAG: hypothetical protein ABI369_06595 [Acetobacteraceae bacterium]